MTREPDESSYVVYVSDTAWREIDRQVRYIALECLAPLNASRWVSRLLAAIDGLESLPEAHPLDPRQTRLHEVEVRCMTFEKQYLVFYTIDDHTRRVDIVAFRHGARER